MATPPLLPVVPDIPVFTDLTATSLHVMKKILTTQSKSSNGRLKTLSFVFEHLPTLFLLLDNIRVLITEPLIHKL